MFRAASCTDEIISGCFYTWTLGQDTAGKISIEHIFTQKIGDILKGAIDMKFSTDVQCMQSTHASFSSFHRFLTGFRSGLAIIAALFSFPWLCVWDHCPAETSIFVSSSSCGQMAADCIWECICTFFLFILPSIIWSTSVPYADKQPHTMRFPPPNLIVGMVFGGW